MAEELRSRLAYFSRLSGVSQKLSTAGSLSVSGPAFAALLNSLDEAILFLQHNPHYKVSLLHHQHEDVEASV